MKLNKKEAQAFLEEIKTNFIEFKEKSESASSLRFPLELKNLICEGSKMGFSQAELCRSSGVSPSGISKWISNHRQAKSRRIQISDPIALPEVKPKAGISIRFSSGTTVELNDINFVTIQGWALIFSKMIGLF